MRLNEIMRDKGHTDKSLADKLGCSPSTVYQWRTGIYQPRLEYLPKLCQVLKCSCDDLLDIHGVKSPKLTRAQYLRLYRAVTANGLYSSDMLHQMGTAFRKANGGKTTAFERWLRELAEVVYKVELIAGGAPTKVKKVENQLNLFES